MTKVTKWEKPPRCPECGAVAVEADYNAAIDIGPCNVTTTYACGTKILDWQLCDPKRYEVTKGSSCKPVSGSEEGAW